MKQWTPLLVADARKDPEWKHTPDIKLGMTFFLGYPLRWPDDVIFGTICTFDGKDNPEAVRSKSLVSEPHHVVEGALRVITEASGDKDLLAKLQRHRDQLLEMVAFLKNSKERLKERIGFESHCGPHQEAGLRKFDEFLKSDLDLAKALDEIKKLKEQLEADNVYLREKMEFQDDFADIVGVSNPIKYVMYRIKQVAPSSTTVLLPGETGTGKGVFARALQEASNRKEKPFVHVNCAGLPPNLMESELFGREKGAFTGSTARQIGRFELANGGTLFLDEIGELPIELQAKLLRVIEDGEFERLGSPHPVKVDVRIIASTNRNLEEEIQKGQFRKDLFYRLNVFPVTIPPLRQRREDIPLLVKFYADRFGKSHRKPIKMIPANTMKALEEYAWPGNVRELMNVIERAVIVSEGPELRLAEKIGRNPSGYKEETDKVMTETGTRGLSEVVRDHILRTLQETGWRIEGSKGAAQVLGLNPSTLRARMKKLAIKRPESRRVSLLSGLTLGQG